MGKEVIIIILALMLVVSFFKKKKKPENKKIIIDALPYKEKYILTKNEYIFYLELEKAATKMKWKICPKVGLKELFEITEKRNYMSYFGRIAQKHIDFLICNEKLHPLYAIELDDNSHKNRTDSDEFKDKIFEKSSVKLVRIKAQTAYSEEYILRNIQSKIEKDKLKQDTSHS